MMFWFEECENTLVDGPLVQYVYICALNGISALDWVAYCTQMKIIRLVIHCSAICPHLLPDGIAYCRTTSHVRTPHMQKSKRCYEFCST